MHTFPAVMHCSYIQYSGEFIIMFYLQFIGTVTPITSCHWYSYYYYESPVYSVHGALALLRV